MYNFTLLSMKEIQLTQGKVALVDDADLIYLNQWKWYASKVKNVYYAKRNSYENGVNKNIKMHRQILNILDAKGIEGEHKDGNGLNNQRSNLRIATRSQNNANIPSRDKSSSKYKGVTYCKRDGNWEATITKNRVKTYLGRFEIETDAALAYNKKAVEVHGEFARLNEF